MWWRRSAPWEREDKTDWSKCDRVNETHEVAKDAVGGTHLARKMIKPGSRAPRFPLNAPFYVVNFQLFCEIANQTIKRESYIGIFRTIERSSLRARMKATMDKCYTRQYSVHVSADVLPISGTLTKRPIEERRRLFHFGNQPETTGGIYFTDSFDYLYYKI